MTVDTTMPRTRRAILLGAAGAAAATAAAAVGRASPASAADGDVMRVGQSNYATDGLTSIYSSNDGALYCESDLHVGITGQSHSADGIHGTSNTKLGVRGLSGTNVGVSGVTSDNVHPAILGQSFGNSTGVQGFSGGAGATAPLAPAKTGVFGSSLSGTGVRGDSDSGYGVIGSSPSGQGVRGSSLGNIGVYGESAATDQPAIIGNSFGNSTGVQGFSRDGGGSPPAAPANTGVFGFANQSAAAVGVNGQSPNGRGGVFSGGAAQLRLMPSTASTHPAAGVVGDLFLDKNHRLWFCKGGATWKQIA